MKSKVDPLIRETRKAYKASPRFELDRLIADRRKWQRRLTIAQNKLDEVDLDIRILAIEYVPIEGKGTNDNKV